MALWEIKITKQTKNTQTYVFYVPQTPPRDKFITNMWLNSCCHLLRILSVLSISSSKVVFTDRLCGERSLSATWPVIFSSVGKHRHHLGVLNIFSLGFYFVVTTPAEESVWSVQELLMVRMTDYSQGNELKEGVHRDCLPQSLTWPVTQQPELLWWLRRLQEKFSERTLRLF